MVRWKIIVTLIVGMSIIAIVQCSHTTVINKANKYEYIFGYVKSGFESVREEFEKNFLERGEIGAALSVYYKGEIVADLWGGHRTGNDIWRQNTKTLVFSATKGMASMVFAKLHSEGRIDYNARVSAYWPEFAANGKDGITVRQLLSHQGGLVLLENRLHVSRMGDYDYIADELERVKPLWSSGDYHGYHAGTVGMYMQELVRRVDPKHRTLGTYFREEIAAPLDIDFYIGLPDDINDNEISEIVIINPFFALFNLGKLPKGMRSIMINPYSLFMRSIRQTKGYNPNKRETWRIEEPSGNGIGTARAIAKLYGIMSTGGLEIGIVKMTMDEITGKPETPKNGYTDKVLNIEARYKVGFMKPDPLFTFSHSDKAFGFLGATGTFAFADPDRQLGYAYVTRKMGYYGINDPREKSVREQVYRCIEKLHSGN